MSKGIRLSEKYGVNPTIPVCFFCGEEKNEIALMGKMTNGKRGRHSEEIEAPMYMVIDYEPCDCCREKMEQGVSLIEVSDIQPVDGRPPMKAEGDVKVYPLGRLLVVKPEAFSKMTNREWKAGQTCFVDSDIMDNLTK